MNPSEPLFPTLTLNSQVCVFVFVCLCFSEVWPSGSSKKIKHFSFGVWSPDNELSVLQTKHTQRDHRGLMKGVTWIWFMSRNICIWQCCCVSVWHVYLTVLWALYQRLNWVQVQLFICLSVDSVTWTWGWQWQDFWSHTDVHKDFLFFQLSASTSL